VIVGQPERRHVPLIVIRREFRAVGDFDDFVLQEQSAGHRPVLHDTRVRVAQIS
jgi:hypothetical protein